jgi:hypothetical protein
VGGRWQLQDAVTCNQLSQTNGHLDTNSQNVTSLLWIQNNGTTTTTLGSTQWTVNGAGTSSVNISWSASGTHTFTANTATVTITSDSTTPSTASAGRDTNGLSIVFAPLSASSAVAFAGGTWRNVSRTGSGSITLSANLTVTGTLTLTGTNSTTNRMIVQSDTLGTPRVITAAAVALTDTDFMDITGAGAATWSGTRLGGCLGNSGITFQTSRTLYGVAAGNFSSSAMWSLSSGGTAGEAAPLPQDDVVLDAASAAGTYTNNLPRTCRNFTATGFTRTFSQGAVGFTVYGNLTLGSGMTYSSGTSGLNLRGRGAQTITTGGVLIDAGYSVNFYASGGTYTAQDDWTAGTQLASGVSNAPYIEHYAGTIDWTGRSVKLSRYSNTGTLTRSLVAVNASISVSYNTSMWNIASSTGMSMSMAGSTITVVGTSTSARTFAGAGFTYGALVYTVANSTGSLIITGANTFDSVTIGAGRQVTFPANTVTRVGDLNVQGAKADGFYMQTTAQGSVAASAARPPGDFTFDIHFAQDNWTSGSDQSHVGLWVAGRLSWLFSTRGGSGGIPMVALSIDGTASASIFASGSPSVSYVNGQATWLRAAVDIDNGSSQRSVRFYQSPDGVTWTQLGTTRTAATAGACFNTADPMVLNISATTGIRYHRVKLYDTDLGNAAGTPTVDLDLNAKPFLRDYASESLSGAPMTFTGANVLLGDGRTLVRSSIAGTGATIQLTGSVSQYENIDIQDIVFNGSQAFLGGQARVSSGVKGLRRSPQYGLMV